MTPRQEKKAGWSKSRPLARKPSRSEVVSKSIATNSWFDGAGSPAAASRLRFSACVPGQIDLEDAQIARDQSGLTEREAVEETRAEDDLSALYPASPPRQAESLR